MPEERQAVDAPDVAVPAQGSVPQHPAEQEHGPAAVEEPYAPEEPQAPATQDVTAAGTGVQPPVEPKRTRLSATWVALGCFSILLLFALLFILQNGHSVDISYLGAHGHLPLGVALLLAGLCGAALVGLAGTARILQLRNHARRQRKQS
jgi:uncharacterized integral membrane protein